MQQFPKDMRCCARADLPTAALPHPAAGCAHVRPLHACEKSVVAIDKGAESKQMISKDGKQAQCEKMPQQSSTDCGSYNRSAGLPMQHLRSHRAIYSQFPPSALRVYLRRINQAWGWLQGDGNQEDAAVKEDQIATGFFYVELYRGKEGTESEVIGAEGRAQAAATDIVNDTMARLKSGRISTEEFMQYMNSRAGPDAAQVRRVFSPCYTAGCCDGFSECAYILSFPCFCVMNVLFIKR
jgi:hypothetical protein